MVSLKLDDLTAVLREMPLCISGVGMISSLGTDVVTSCAAARAGLVRTCELSNYPLWSPVDGEVSGVIAHAAPEITAGFESDARELRLMSAALADLERRDAVIEPGTERLATYLSLRDPARIARCGAWVSSEDAQQTMQQLLDAWEDIPPDHAEIQARVERAVQLCHGGWRPDVRGISQRGATGLAEILAAAAADLAAGHVSQALLIAVDSLLDEATLAWLESTARLKSAEYPAGLAPGEAGVALVIEPLATAQRQGRRSWAEIRSVFAAADERPYDSGAAPLGRAIAQLLLDEQQRRADDDTTPFWILSDQNGEYYRAADWGYGLVTARQQAPQLADPLLWYPAMSFGDTGAASSAVAVAMATRAFARHYAPAPRAMVLSASDGPDRTAIVLSRPEAPPPPSIPAP